MMRAHITPFIDDTHSRMQARFADICQEFDFSHFSLAAFVDWLERKHGKPILFCEEQLPPTFFGAWIEADDASVIFFDKSAISLHRLHIQLHELAHILCGHKTICITDEHKRAYALGLLKAEDLLFRSSQTSVKEKEAELLAVLIQKEIYKHKRHHELDNAITAYADMHELYQALGLIR
ncbi:hypothetical protein GC175_11620 [bacterium]|nr:hypothetical protein [bacterium]